MVFDLRRALLAKEERESTRLMDFEFRLRARTWRLLAARIDRDPDKLARLIAEGDDNMLIERLRAELPDQNIASLFAASQQQARRQLMDEIGNPAPHRLV